MKLFWPQPEAWADHAVVVSIEELACCLPMGVNADDMLARWASYGNHLDAYILPSPSGDHCAGIRYGSSPRAYLSPPFDAKPLAALLERHRPAPAQELVG